MIARLLPSYVAIFIIAMALCARGAESSTAAVPRIGKLVAELRLADAGNYRLMSAMDQDGPGVEECEKILKAATAADPRLARFARSFPAVPTQIIPINRDGEIWREFQVVESVAVGPYQVELDFLVRLGPEAKAAMRSVEVYRFFAYYVPPEAEKWPMKPTLADIGTTVGLKLDDMEGFAHDPAAFLRAHVPITLGQPAVMWGLTQGYDAQVRMQFYALKGPTPAAEKIVTPSYPTGLMRARIAGEVTFEASIRPDGRVVDFRVVKSSQLEFSKAVETAVLSWKFVPQSTPFGDRAEIMEQFARRAKELPRPLPLGGKILFTAIEE